MATKKMPDRQPRLADAGADARGSVHAARHGGHGNVEKTDFIDGIEYGGAATFMKFAGETDFCLFI